ncbi:hypothetical protein SEA_KIPPER29_72 [Mycobacterium phage Kipper29]|uniref:Uncharacterized protein n=2 Tax=Gladiatorvirus ericB TaxID=1041406 RepID=G1EBU3_9CAUD|nr:hypothetical protein AXJ19_gp040 [Mycobacterium phage VohminGhazi]YP_009637875.1 hypothetical protein FGG32_gp038 [Mycobacterium phage EricB]AEK08513.1 hypothetical protein PBI_DAVINCI_70 [Mycobacterium phage DaVinci]AMW64421.1 hypothetical protein PBI_KAZAN_73 [Mycobacterium phage Kazan]QDF15853.1 hypothetical protein SEA_KIPPER29_72 [Mycobacterium phage Kipper29]QXO14823.1 hypothetical protein SEA_SMELLYB_72 [Mycobacterium phage SmellyB]QYW01271.1 hypothetical protein SEA_HOOT_67 [Mycoba
MQIVEKTALSVDYEKDEIVIEPPEGARVSVVTYEYPSGRQVITISRDPYLTPTE